MGLFAKLIKSQVEPQIEAGSYWVCCSEKTLKITSHSIFAKVLKVTENKIFISRKTKYGYEDMAPASFTTEEFLELYFKLED